jgi:tetratricopeptide (TPR) repeat protein
MRTAAASLPSANRNSDRASRNAASPVRIGIILLSAASAASLGGCGAYSSDRLALAHNDAARRAAAEASAAAQSRDAEGAERAIARAFTAVDGGLALATSSEARIELLATRYQLDRAQQDETAAQRSIDRLARVDPTHPLAAILRCEHEVAAGRPEQGLAALDAALRFRPGADDLLWLAGTLDLTLGDGESADRRFAMLLVTGEAHGSDWAIAARIGLAAAAALRVGADAGAPELKRAIDADFSQSILVIQELAQRDRELERILRAVVAAARRDHEDDASLGFIKAFLDRGAGQSQLALETIERTLGNDDGSRTADLLWLAFQIHVELGQTTAAKVRLKALLDVMPWHVPALSAFVEGVLRAKDDDLDRDSARRYVAAAREHFEARRDEIFVAAGRDAAARRSALADNDRYLSLLAEMEAALASRS